MGGEAVPLRGEPCGVKNLSESPAAGEDGVDASNGCIPESLFGDLDSTSTPFLIVTTCGKIAPG
jgi:hypothetical protein